MLFKAFDVDSQCVYIDEVVIDRPDYISPSQWLGFWEVCQEIEDGQDIINEQDYNALESENSSLGQEVVDLKAEVEGLERDLSGAENEIGDLKDEVTSLTDIIASMERRLEMADEA